MTQEPERTVHLVADDDRWSVDARLAASGNLVFDGQDLGGPYAEYEWGWTFTPSSFPLIRFALGGEPGEDVLDLVQEAFADKGFRDPGAWLHKEKGVPAEFWSRMEP